MENQEAGQECMQGHEWQRSLVKDISYCSRSQCKAIRDDAAVKRVTAQIQQEFGVMVQTTPTSYYYSLTGLSLQQMQAITALLENLLNLTPVK